MDYNVYPTAAQKEDVLKQPQTSDFRGIPGSYVHTGRIPEGHVGLHLHHDALARHSHNLPRPQGRDQTSIATPLQPPVMKARFIPGNAVQQAYRSPFGHDLGLAWRALQPETTPISQDQLAAEFNAIYAGLVTVESKCIEIDNVQSSESERQLKHKKWQALIAVHRALLHEHHDFFLASQHPSASPALRRLASKHEMPATMWRHGIHHSLELIRHCPPASPEHMLTFIYLAYPMMGLLYETVSTFEDTRIKYFGDLGRYRTAINDDGIYNRDVWDVVPRDWYSCASDKIPVKGRLYYHATIHPMRPNALQQLFYYTKDSSSLESLSSAPGLSLTLSDPILGRTAQHTPSMALEQARHTAQNTYEIVFRRFAVPNVLPHLYTALAFVYHLSSYPQAMAFIQKRFPWRLVSQLLNSLLMSYREYDRIPSDEFPPPAKELPRALPEDFQTTGLPWKEKYFPDSWFLNQDVDDSEGKYFEVPSTSEEGILWPCHHYGKIRSLANEVWNYSPEGGEKTWDEKSGYYIDMALAAVCSTETLLWFPRLVCRWWHGIGDLGSPLARWLEQTFAILFGALMP